MEDQANDQLFKKRLFKKFKKKKFRVDVFCLRNLIFFLGFFWKYLKKFRKKRKKKIHINLFEIKKHISKNDQERNLFFSDASLFKKHF